MIKKLSVVIAVLFLLVMSVGFSSAITGAMGNAKMVLYPEVNGLTNTVIEKSILIKNVNNESINITLQLDSDGEKFLELVDKSFILEPYAEKAAQFIVKVKNEGNYNAKINVFFSSLENKKTGVALSSEITVIAKKDQGYIESSDDNVNTEEDGNTITTGDVTGKEKKSILSGFGLLISLSFALMLILVVLMIALLKKNGEKRRKKVNARKKV